MPIIKKLRILINFFINFIFIFLFLININLSFAWSGYDFDNKTEIEIEAGNLVREGLIIEFYDSNTDEYHNAKVLYIESAAGGQLLRVEDYNLNIKRNLIMED